VTGLEYRYYELRHDGPVQVARLGENETIRNYLITRLSLDAIEERWLEFAHRRGDALPWRTNPRLEGAERQKTQR